MRGWPTWCAAALAIACVERATLTATPMQRMCALVATTFLAMKLVVAVAARAEGLPRLPALHWLAFLVHFGMHPRAFAVRQPRHGQGELLREGLAALSVGLVCYGVALTVKDRPLLAVPLVFVAASATVHFGLLALFVAGLRSLGFAAERLFRAPWRARSLAEFWGRRWNLGFAEMCAITVFRPLSRRHGRTVASAMAFLLSGLLHEVAITLPVRAGLGLPTLYFVVQALAVTVEERLRFTSRVWTAVVLLAPLPLLFPAPFVRAIVAPLLGA